jgi:hypothetical protein
MMVAGRRFYTPDPVGLLRPAERISAGELDSFIRREEMNSGKRAHAAEAQGERAAGPACR